MSRARVRLDWSPHPKQQDVLRWVPEPNADGSATVSVVAVLGGYGSGKTTCSAWATILHACRSGWRSGYGEDRPRIVVMAPTARGLRDNIVPIYERACPRTIVRKRWGQPHPRWLLANGCELLFMSGDSAAIEGMTLCGMHIDEISHPVFADSARWTNLLARLRDPLAVDLRMIVSGLPALGFVRDTFDLDALDEDARRNRLTTLIGTRDNPHIPQELVDQILATVPSGYESALVEGGWLPSKGSLFPMFRDDTHLVPDDREDKTAPVHVGLDVGVSSCAVLGQELPVQLKTGKTDRGVLIVGDIVGSHVSVEDMATAIRDSQWGARVIPGKSTICVDPTIRSDETNAIRKVFPGVHVLIRKRTDPLYHNDAGLRLMQAGLRNASGDVHIYLCARVKKAGKDGLYAGLLGAAYNERTGRMNLTNRYHCVDAGKYLVQHMLGDRGPAPSARRM